MRYQSLFGEVGIAVMVHGKEIAEFPHGDGKTYVWAKNGTEYSIVNWNYTDFRVEMVITVDGLDIINGKVGDYRTVRGYVIDSRTKPKPIPGFKLDGNSAARFKFGSPEGSYAALMDKPINIGVIGAAFFIERPQIPVYRGNGGGNSYSYGDVMRGGGGTLGASVGTEFGRKTDFFTSTTSFIRENPEPMALLALYYHTAERLKEMGIDVHRPHLQVADSSPNPFPGSTDGCKPPPNWTPR